MSEIFESTDRVRRIDQRELGYNIVEGEVAMGSPLISLSTGYNGYVEVDITALNLGIQVPQVSAIYYKTTSLGGGVTQYDHITLPFTIWNTNGTIQEAAYMTVYYQALSKSDPLAATSRLVIWYYNRSSNSGGQIFYYKIKASAATS